MLSNVARCVERISHNFRDFSHAKHCKSIFIESLTNFTFFCHKIDQNLPKRRIIYCLQIVNLDGRRGHVDRLPALLDQLILLFRRLLAPVGELSVDVRIFRALFLHLRKRRVIALDRKISNHQHSTIILILLLVHAHGNNNFESVTAALE